MFKNLKLGQKIALGFASLIIIAVFLGGLAVVSMKSTQSGAAKLDHDFVPSVAVANNIERYSLLTMYEMRGYAYTEEEMFWTDGHANLSKVQQYLQEAADLADKSKNLEVLKENAALVSAKIQEYDTLANDTKMKIDAMNTARGVMDEKAQSYMKECDDFLASMNGEFQKEVSSGAGKAKLQERVQKINWANEIIELGNATRIGVWRSQAERDPKLAETTIKNFDGILKKLDELKTVTRQEANLKQIENCRAAGLAYKDAFQTLLDNWLALQEINTKRTEVATAVLAGAQDTATKGMEETTNIARAANLSLSAASVTMLIGLAIAVALGVVMAIFITRSITGPINKVIEGMSSGSEQVAAAANQVSSSSQQLAEGASEQASSLEEVSSSLEEMTSMTKQNADNAKQADTMSGEAERAAAKGAEAMGRMAEAIEKIKTSSDETAKIIKTIDEIAFQTNLLALNAAVEAARAGEAGMGFAVVAEEVRNLAKRSAEAAKNTSALIEGSQANAANGVTVTREVAEILNEIARAAKNVKQLIGEVSAASDEQSQGIAQVNTAISQMDQVTQSSAANAEESASASEELSSQAAELNSLVNVLISIVGGAGSNGNGHARPAIARPAGRMALTAPKSVKKVLAAAYSAGGTKKSKTSNPEDVIPLDSDFDEF